MGDTICIGYDVINILGVMSYIQGCDVLKSSSNDRHTEYDFIHIMPVMLFREWVCM